MIYVDNNYAKEGKMDGKNMHTVSPPGGLQAFTTQFFEHLTLAITTGLGGMIAFVILNHKLIGGNICEKQRKLPD